MLIGWWGIKRREPKMPPGRELLEGCDEILRWGGLLGEGVEVEEVGLHLLVCHVS